VYRLQLRKAMCARKDVCKATRYKHVTHATVCYVVTQRCVQSYALMQTCTLCRDVDEEVLPLGAVLSALPVDLAIGKLLILSTIFGLEDEMLTIAAALSIQPLFVRVDPGSSEATRRQVCVAVCVSVYRQPIQHICILAYRYSISVYRHTDIAYLYIGIPI